MNTEQKMKREMKELPLAFITINVGVKKFNIILKDRVETNQKVGGHVRAKSSEQKDWIWAI